MKFAEKAKYLRNSADMTQQELSKHLGITASAIGFLENGQREPTGRTLVAYAKFFNTSIDSLVGLETTDDDPPVFSNKKIAPTLSQDEQALLEDYRALAPALQEMLRATIATWKGTDANTSSAGTKRRNA